MDMNNISIYISSFYNIRFFTENIIPIGTAGNWPWWVYKSDNIDRGKQYVNKNNVLLGIREELFFNARMFDNLDEKCSSQCPYKMKVPHCQFMDAYRKHLQSLDFDAIIADGLNVADKVRAVTHYKGNPIFVLLVYESKSCLCAERPCLQEWFKDHGYNLMEWDKEMLKCQK